MKFKNIALIISACVLSSCGTIKSLDNNNNKVYISHPLVVTNCNEISRIYSGLQYDWCLFDSERKNTPPKVMLDPLWLNSIDIILSTVADTVVLPYTIYQQSTHGSLEVAK